MHNTDGFDSEDPEEYLVLSVWASEQAWNEWFQNEQRAQVQHPKAREKSQGVRIGKNSLSHMLLFR